jgi:hypothetical protein
MGFPVRSQRHAPGPSSTRGQSIHLSPQHLSSRPPSPLRTLFHNLSSYSNAACGSEVRLRRRARVRRPCPRLIRPPSPMQIIPSGLPRVVDRPNIMTSRERWALALACMLHASTATAHWSLETGHRKDRAAGVICDHTRSCFRARPLALSCVPCPCPCRRRYT